MPIMTNRQIREIKDSFKEAIIHTDAVLFEQNLKRLTDYLNPPSQPSMEDQSPTGVQQPTLEEQTQKLNDIATILNTQHSNCPNIFLRAAAEFPNSMPRLLAIIANLPSQEQQKLLLSTTLPCNGFVARSTVLMIAAQTKQPNIIEMIITQIKMIEFLEKDQPIKSLSLKNELTKISTEEGNVLMYAVGFDSELEQDLATIKSILSHVEKLDAQTQKSIFSQFNQWPTAYDKIRAEFNQWPTVPERFTPGRVKPVYNSIKKLSLTHADVAEEILNGTEVKALKSLYEAEQALRAKYKGLFFKHQDTTPKPMSIYNAIGNADL